MKYCVDIRTSNRRYCCHLKDWVFEFYKNTNRAIDDSRDRDTGYERSTLVVDMAAVAVVRPVILVSICLLSLSMKSIVRKKGLLYYLTKLFVIAFPNF